MEGQTATATYDEDFYENRSLTDGASSESEVKRPRDSGFHRVKIGPKHSRRTVEYYESGTHFGATIRYAITGFRTSHKVGTSDQDLYFKAVSTIHPAGENGVHLPSHLYYDSPEQWERHFHTTCPEAVKAAWLEKRAARIHRLQAGK